MESTARMLRTNRIVIGGGIPHPFGNPDLSLDQENKFRERILKRTFLALKTKVKESTTFS